MVGHLIAGRLVPVKRPPKSSADATHRARGRNEVWLANVMPGFLAQDDRFEPLAYFIVGIAISKQRAQIVLGHAEQAGADFAVGGEPDAIAMAAKRFAHRRDDADFAATVGERPAPGSLGRILDRKS